MNEAIPKNVRVKGLALVRSEDYEQINPGTEVEIDIARFYELMMGHTNGGTGTVMKPLPPKRGFPRCLVSCYLIQQRFCIDMDGIEGVNKGCETSFVIPTDPVTFTALATSSKLDEGVTLFYQAIEP